MQDAFVAAIDQWRDPGAVPAEPGAWLHTVARRKVVDALRRALGSPSTAIAVASLRVGPIEAIDDTPVVDIKPVLR